DAYNQGRMIVEVDADTDVVLEDVKEAADEAKEIAEDAKLDENEDETKPAEVQEVVDVVTPAKLITEVVTATSGTVTAASAIITATEAQVPTAKTVVTLIAAPARVTTAPSRRRKGVVIRDPEEESTTSTIIPTETKSKNKGLSYDDIRPVFEKYFDFNVAFLVKSKEHMDEEDNRALKKLNETPAERATKRQKLDKEVEELKRHLQIVPNEDDDVYTEATPLAQKVPVVDYQIIEMNN
nr:hypothetical protein [Tanacetum cinerariifolium]